MNRNVFTFRTQSTLLMKRKHSLSALVLALCALPATGQLVINEALFDPESTVDPNGDGIPSTQDDEFLEIVNTGSSALDVGDYTITDLSGNVFIFPVGTMIASQAAVLVFGGGAPTTVINGANTYVGLPSLNNSADTIILADSTGTELDRVGWSGGGVASDQSYNRSPELFGDFTSHTAIAGSVGTESPGTAVDGGSFNFSVSSLFLTPENVSIIESGAGNSAEFTVTLADAPSSYPVSINLSSSDATEATAPASIEIASGLTGTFTVTGVDDTVADGAQTVTITASSSAFRSDSIELTVMDDGDVAMPSTSPLLITQYYEGDTGNNKYVELTNVSDSDLDLSGYIVGLYFNGSAENFKTEGSTPGNQEPLSGTLAAGASYVIANSQSTTPLAAGSADITSTVTFFNGNDSIVLYSGDTISPATIADAVSFTDGGNEGMNASFIRQNEDLGFSLDAGSTVLDFSNVWIPVPLLDVAAAALGDDVFLGSSGLGTNVPVLSFVSSTVTVGEAAGTANLLVRIQNPDGNAVSVDVVYDDASSSASAADIGGYSTQTVTFAAGAMSGDSQSIAITITDDAEAESSENALFSLENIVTDGAARTGGGASSTLNIQDNDTVIPPVFISEIADPADPDYRGRFIELYNPTASDIDLSAGNWNLAYYSNANTSGTDIPLVGIIPAMGTYVIANNFDNFTGLYPTASEPNQVSSTFNSNGDDNVELRFGGGESSGALVDVYGMPGTDGSGMSWEFENSRVDRITGAPNATFTIEEWIITPAGIADMTPGVHGGGGPVGGVEVEVVDFFLNQEDSSAVIVVKGLGAKIWKIQTSDDLGGMEAWADLSVLAVETDNADGSTNFTFSTVGGDVKQFYRLIEQ